MSVDDDNNVVVTTHVSSIVDIIFQFFVAVFVVNILLKVGVAVFKVVVYINVFKIIGILFQVVLLIPV